MESKNRITYFKLNGKKILDGKMPKPNNDCDFCKYRNAVREVEKSF